MRTEVRLEGVDMKEYEVIGHATVVCSMHVKANEVLKICERGVGGVKRWKTWKTL